MTIKKAYKEIIELLEANTNKKVASILEEAKELASAKKANTTFKTNDKGEVTEIFCYYHKRWEKLSEHAYGVKANTATGFNTMCKMGVSHWTKQNRRAKKDREMLLKQVAVGEVPAEEINEHMRKIEEKRAEIVEQLKNNCKANYKKAASC